MKAKPPSQNLMDLRPRRNVEWEEDPEGNVVILAPKFRNRVLARWLLPILRKPKFRVKLDRYGAFVWRRCDGRASVFEIVEEMRVSFGEAERYLHERAASFVTTLVKHGFLAIGDVKPGRGGPSSN